MDELGYLPEKRRERRVLSVDGSEEAALMSYLLRKLFISLNVVVVVKVRQSLRVVCRQDGREVRLLESRVGLGCRSRVVLVLGVGVVVFVVVT